MKKIVTVLFLVLGLASLWAKSKDEMLLDAVRQQNLEDLEYVLDTFYYSANVNFTDANGKSALMYACEGQWYPGIKKLLNAGVNVSFKNDFGQNALMYASKYIDNQTIFSLLVNSGTANIDDTDNLGRSALFYAIENESPIALDVLLKNRANVNKTDLDGNDALIWAVKCKNESAVEKILKSSRVNWSQLDSSGNSAFMNACIDGSLNIVRTILMSNNSFDIYTKTQSGLPILLWLIDKKMSNNILRYVIEFIPYTDLISQTDDFGNDVFYYAYKMNNQFVLDLLEEKRINFEEYEELKKARKR